MERILINDDILKYAQKYEQAFRRYQLDVPTRLRNIASKLDKHNDKNKLSPDELEQYKNYVEEIANDYDNAVDETKNLLVLQPQHFQEYIDKYERFDVELDKELFYHEQGGGKKPGP